MLFSLATRPPANVPALLAACHPTPPPVRMHAADLVALIARTQASSSTVQPDQPSSVADETLPMPVPVHTRFADHHVNGDILTPDIMASARDIAAQKSALFGSIASSSGDERESEAMRRAQQVRASLVLQPPAVPTAVVAATSNEPEFTPVLPSKRKRTEEAPAAPAPAPEPVVLSETYAAYHAPTIKQKKLADPSAMQLPKIALGDIDDDDSDGGSGNQLTLANKVRDSSRKEKNKGNKKKKTTTPVEVSSTDVTPFQYSDNQDSEVIGESSSAATDKKKAKKPRHNKKSFDPYSQITTTKELAKKPSRSR
ncbi:hypothetical protein GGI21_006595, partial [Coemansia aciculifera]